MIKKILIITWLLFTLFIINVNAQYIDLWKLNKVENNNPLTKIQNVTIDKSWTWDIVEDANMLWFSLLKTIKMILEWILIIYIVYAWATMIMAMWDDDAKITKAKTQLRYSLLAVVFINVPWVLFNTISKWDRNKTIEVWENWWTFVNSSQNNPFLNIDLFSTENWIIGNIISAIEVFIFIIAIYVIIMAGIKIMTSRWKDEKVTEAKWKILYSIFAMLFVWFIEAWKQLAITWEIEKWTYIFWKFTDIALLFAWPVVIIFLTLAWYYYITANWDEDKTKKAKSIIINTLIAIVLLLVMVTFLNDLLTL
jgi:hypothetical protein